MEECFILLDIYRFRNELSAYFKVAIIEDKNKTEKQVIAFVNSLLYYIRKWNKKNDYLYPINQTINLSVYYIYSELCC